MASRLFWNAPVLFTSLKLMGFTGRYVKVYQSNGDGVKNRKRSRKMDGQGLLYCKPLFSQRQCFICSVQWELTWKLTSSPCTWKRHTGIHSLNWRCTSRCWLLSSSDAQLGHNVGALTIFVTGAARPEGCKKTLAFSLTNTKRNRDTQSEIRVAFHSHLFKGQFYVGHGDPDFGWLC